MHLLTLFLSAEYGLLHKPPKRQHLLYTQYPPFVKYFSAFCLMTAKRKIYIIIIIYNVYLLFREVYAIIY